MSTQKDLGNAEFKAKNFEKAIEYYTTAIEETPTDHSIYGNRAAAYLKLNEFIKSMEDAEKCIELKPDWAKGYQRKGNALHSMGQRAEALLSYQKGVEIDPSNEALKKEMLNLQNEIKAQNMGGGFPGGMGGGFPGGMGGMPGGMGGMPGGMGGMPGGMGGGMGGGNPFGGGDMFSEEKLKQNPRIAKYFEDPQFNMKFQMAK